MKHKIILTCLAALEVLLIVPPECYTVPMPTGPPPATTTAPPPPPPSPAFAKSGDLSVENVTDYNTDLPQQSEPSGKSGLGNESEVKNQTVTTKEGDVVDIAKNLTAKLSSDGNHPVQALSDDAKDDDSESGKHSGLEVKEKAHLKPLKATPPPLSNEDQNIRRAWGGDCTKAVWDVCSRIRSWGGDYIVPDKNNPDKLVVKSFKLSCVEKPEKTFCLKNGWTVARCHMLCMSQCNREYRLNYEKLVAHEGECKMPILGRKK